MALLQAKHKGFFATQTSFSPFCHKCPLMFYTLIAATMFIHNEKDPFDRETIASLILTPQFHMHASLCWLNDQHTPLHMVCLSSSVLPKHNSMTCGSDTFHFHHSKQLPPQSQGKPCIQATSTNFG